MSIRYPRTLWLALFALLFVAIPQWLHSAPAQGQTAPDWLAPDWTHRMPITITNPGGALDGQQVRILLDSTFPFALTAPNGADLRVTTADGVTQLPLWIERWQPATAAVLWTRLPGLEAGTTQTLYLYYGNPSAPSAADPGNIFEVYEGFETPLLGPPLANAAAYQDTPTYDGSNQVVHPDIVYFPDTWRGHQYWLVMEPYPYSQDGFENPSILVSADGATWEQPAGIDNPVARTNTSYLADADIFYDEASDELWMYYPHQMVNGQTLMLHKTSVDGVTWGDPYDENVVFTAPDFQLLSPALVKTGATYKMWTVNTGSAGCTSQDNTVQLRTSRDGVNWSAPADVNLSLASAHAWHIDVIYVPSKAQYWALVSGYVPGYNCMKTDLYFATSGDGINWTTYATPALRTAALGSAWDSGQIYRATLVYDEAADRLRVWYSANNGPEWRQGYSERDYSDFLEALTGNSWMAGTGSGAWTRTTEQAVRGTGAGKFVQLPGSNYSAGTQHAAITDVVQEWEFYDDLDTSAYGMVAMVAGRFQIGLGVDTDVVGDRYVWRDAAGGVTPTTQSRTQGWHTFGIHLTSGSTATFFVDGVEAGSTAVPFVNSDGIVLAGSGDNDTTFYVDDVRIRRQPAADLLISVNGAPAPTPTPSPAPTATPALQPFPATTILDNFDRVAGGIGAAWTGTTDGYAISSNHLAASGGEGIYWSATRFDSAQEAYVTLATVPVTATELGIILKAQTGDGAYTSLIDVLYLPGQGQAQVWTYTGGIGWQLMGSGMPVVFAPGDRLGARARADGIVEVYRNDELVGMRSLGAWPYRLGDGHIGIFLHGAPGATLDDFGGGAVPSVPTPTATSTPVPTATLTETATNTPTPTSTPTATATDTPTSTPVLLPTATPTETATPLATNTATATNTPVPTSTATETATSTPTVTATPVPTSTPTATATNTPLPTSTPTETATPLPTSTTTATATDTPVPTGTPTATSSPTVTATPVPTITPIETATPVPTSTPTETATPVPTSTPTATVTNTPLPTNTPTETATSSPIPTNTMTPALMPMHTPTATPTATPTEVTGAGFPSTALIDTFNRANSTNIGTNWTGSKSGYRIENNRLDVGESSDIYWRPASYGANQEVYVTLTTIDAKGLELGLALKAQSRTGLGSGLLDVLYSPSNKNIQVWTYTRGIGWRQQGTAKPITLNNGDRLGARAYANGTVEVYVNEALIAVYSVSNWRYAASSGYIGIFTLDAPGAVLDDFGGGAIGLSTADIVEELPPEVEGPEEFHMLRYKANVWLPAVEARPPAAEQSGMPAFTEAPLAPQASGQSEPGQLRQLYLPIIQAP